MLQQLLWKITFSWRLGRLDIPIVCPPPGWPASSTLPSAQIPTPLSEVDRTPARPPPMARRMVNPSPQGLNPKDRWTLALILLSSSLLLLRGKLKKPYWSWALPLILSPDMKNIIPHLDRTGWTGWKLMRPKGTHLSSWISYHISFLIRFFFYNHIITVCISTIILYSLDMAQSFLIHIYLWNGRLYTTSILNYRSF